MHRNAIVIREPHSKPRWQRSVERAIRDPEVLYRHLGLPRPDAAEREAHADFGVFVPREYLRKIKPRDRQDPLLLQVMPQAAERGQQASGAADAVGDSAAQIVPGLLHKYEGRALLMPTMNCAVHCRYCFRRNYLSPSFFELADRVEPGAFRGEPAAIPHRWRGALAAIAGDNGIREVILSGGDPLMVGDAALEALLNALDTIEHVEVLRIHTRLPLMIPSRITRRLVRTLRSLRLTVVCVIHANHPAELDSQTCRAIERLLRTPAVLLNQSVLLRGVNDSVPVLTRLSRTLIQCGVVPYYLHQLDRVRGAGHFEVPVEEGRALVAELRKLLPGYAVPRYVREVAGAPHKLPLD